MEYVEELVVAVPQVDIFGEFEVKDMWRMEDEERYWTLSEKHRVK